MCHKVSAVLDKQLLGIKALGIPVRYFQPQCPAQQRLARAQAFDGPWLATGVGVVQLHLRQAVAVAVAVEPGVAGFDQHGVAGPLCTEVK
ncbi:hypothetical protein D3C71_1813700 [compost metagenome]